MSMPEKIPENLGPVGNPEIIRLLESALAQARSGQMAGCAVITSMGPGNTQASAAGGFFAELFMGCAMMQDAIVSAAKGGQGHRSNILMPRRM